MFLKQWEDKTTISWISVESISFKMTKQHIVLLKLWRIADTSFNKQIQKAICAFEIAIPLTLTHFWPMFPFHTPWKHQKTEGRNWGYKLGILARNGSQDKKFTHFWKFNHFLSFLGTHFSTKLPFTYSMTTIETLQKGVKYVQS